MLTLKYTLEKQDFITQSLFSLSRSEVNRKAWNRARIRVPVVYVILGILMYFATDIKIALVFIIVAVLWYFYSPVFLRNRYSKHYDKTIEEKLSNRFGKEVTVAFNNELLETKDYLGESKLKTSAIETIFEIESHILIRFETGESLIIPKRGIKVEDLVISLKDLAKELKIEYVEEFDWKWEKYS